MTKFQDKILNEKLGDKLVVAFMNMTKKNFEKYTLDSATKDAFIDLTEYGTVIFCSMGKASEESKKAIAEMFNYDIKDCIEITTPLKISLTNKS